MDKLMRIPDGTYSFTLDDGEGNKVMFENCTFTGCRLITEEEEENDSTR